MIDPDPGPDDVPHASATPSLYVVPRDDRTPAIERLRPVIAIPPDRSGVVDSAINALAVLGGVYVRGRQLVRVVRDRGAPGWLNRPLGTPVVVPVDREHLEELLDRAAIWTQSSRVRSVPSWVSGQILARQEWPLPELAGLSEVPILRPDGSLCETPGYDAITRTIYDPFGAVFPPVPSEPTLEDARYAIETLLDPFSEFPFVADSDRAATLAMILSMIARSAIDGCVPMFAAQAPTPGSGKGLLVDTAAVIATGRRAPLMAPTADDDETRKRLLAIAIESPSLVVIDNVEGSLGSPSLAMALTSGEIRDRVLGSTQMVTASLRPVWAATGNNVQFRGDLGRRVVPVDLNPQVEHPEDRAFDRSDLISYTLQRRPVLVTAALTILRGYCVARRPAHGLPRKGSFEAWDSLVRGALVWAGGVDPLAGCARIREQDDQELDQLRALLTSWNDLLGARELTLADVIKTAGESGDLHDAMAAYCRGGRVDQRALAYVLRGVRDRVIGGLRLERRGVIRSGSVLWAVR